MRLVTRRLDLALALPLLALVGCWADYHVTDERIVARQDAARDRLDVLVIDRGLAASGNDEQLRGIAEQLASLRKSTRVVLVPDLLLFGMFGGTNTCSLDAEKNEPDECESSKELRARIKVVNGGLFSEETGRLGVWQHWRIEGLQAVIAACNRDLSKWVLAELAKREAAAASPGAEAPPPESTGGPNLFDDAESRALLRTSATAGGNWLELRDGAFCGEIPMSESAKNEFLRWIVRSSHPLPAAAPAKSASGRSAKDDSDPALDAERLCVPLLSQIRAIDHDGRALRLRVGRDGLVDLDFHGPPAEDDASLREHLAKAGVALDAKLTVDEIRRRFDAASSD